MGRTATLKECCCYLYSGVDSGLEMSNLNYFRIQNFNLESDPARLIFFTFSGTTAKCRTQHFLGLTKSTHESTNTPVARYICMWVPYTAGDSVSRRFVSEIRFFEYFVNSLWDLFFSPKVDFSTKAAAWDVSS